MTDIVEKLRGYARDDHERGCQGREYDCSCGYDGKRDTFLVEAADEIERLRAALKEIDNELNTAAQDDCENGVKWLNERAAEGYLKEYPCTLACISKVLRITRAALGGDA